jgi:hypothetical protein
MYLGINLSICLYIYLYTYLSIYLSVYQSVCLYVCLFIHLSISLYLSFYLFINLAICLSVCLYVWLSVYLSIYPYLSIYQSVYLSVCMSDCLSIYLSMHTSICAFIYLFLSLFHPNFQTLHLPLPPPPRNVIAPYVNVIPISHVRWWVIGWRTLFADTTRTNWSSYDIFENDFTFSSLKTRCSHSHLHCITVSCYLFTTLWYLTRVTNKTRQGQ